MALDRALWLQALTDYTADEFRDLIDAAFPEPGVVAADTGQAMAVTQTTTASMNLHVAAGYAAIPAKTGNNKYLVRARAQETVTVTAANTQPRIDLVVVQVSDSDLGDASDTAVFTVVKGTAAASPTPPTVPAGALLLAQINVGANVTAIPNSAITDARAQVVPGVTLLDPAATTNTSPLSAYPTGLSGLMLTGTNAAAGGWPTGGSQSVLTYSPGGSRGFQLSVRNNTTGTPAVFLRAINSGGNGPWAQLRMNVAAGFVIVSISGDSVGNQATTFPAGMFTTVPMVVASTQSSVYFAAVGGVGTGGCTLYARHYQNTVATGTVLVNWIATEQL
jgi:hypothetical protein